MLSPRLAPSDFIEFFHVNAPASKGPGTAVTNARLDVSNFDWLLSILSVGTAVDDITLTPVVYDTPTGGTGVRMDGTNGNPDYTQTVTGDQDNRGFCREMRVASLPKRYLEIEAFIESGGAVNFVLVYLGFKTRGEPNPQFGITTLQPDVDFGTFS